jgi:succinate-acetate transporter protein
VKLHEIYPRNKLLFYTGAIILFTGTYLDGTNKASDTVIIPLLIVALLFMLLGIKKPKQNKDLV